MELLSAIKACLNGPMCAVACDGLKEHRAVTVKMFNTSALIKFKQWKNKEQDKGSFAKRAISPFSHFLRVEDPVVAVVKRCGGNSCVFSPVSDMSTLDWGNLLTVCCTWDMEFSSEELQFCCAYRLFFKVTFTPYILTSAEIPLNLC